MRPLAIAAAGLLLLETIVAVVATADLLPLAITLGGGLLLAAGVVLAPRLIQIHGFLLAIGLAVLWGLALRELTVHAWIFASSLAVHFYALSIVVAQARHPDDQRLASETNWVFGAAFALGFLPVYLLIAKVVEAPAGWIGLLLATGLVAANFLLLEFSRSANAARPWIKPPAALLRVIAYVVPLILLVVVAHIGASAAARHTPEAVEWARRTAQDLRERFQSDVPNDGDDPQDPGATARPGAGAGLPSANLGAGPGTNGPNPEIMVVAFRPEDAAWLTPPRRYMRLRADHEFLGGTWTQGPRRRRLIADEDDGAADGSVTLGPPLGRAIGHTVTLANEAPPALYALPGLHRVVAKALVQEGEDWHRFPRPAPRQYTVASRPVFYEHIRTLPLSLAEPINPDYLQIPDTPSMRRVLRAVRTIPTGRHSIGETVDAYLAHFRNNYRYTLDMEDPGDADRFEHFFFTTRRGYCTYFATALTLMLRDAGIPARVAVGYAGGNADPGSPLVSYRTQHAHAWTEIHLAEHGWVTLDATPPEIRGGGPRIAEIPEPPQDPVGPAAASQPTWLRPVQAALAVAAAVSALVLLTIVARTWKQRADPDRPHPPPGFLRLLRRTFRKHGHPMRSNQTLMEYMRELRRAGLVATQFDPLVEYYYDISYRDLPRKPELEKQLARLVRGYRVPDARP